MMTAAAFDKAIGQAMRRRRRYERVTQEALGKALGLHQTAICRVEKGVQSLTAYELCLAIDFLESKSMKSRKTQRSAYAKTKKVSKDSGIQVLRQRSKI